MTWADHQNFEAWSSECSQSCTCIIYMDYINILSYNIWLREPWSINEIKCPVTIQYQLNTNRRSICSVKIIVKFHNFKSIILNKKIYMYSETDC